MLVSSRPMSQKTCRMNFICIIRLAQMMVRAGNYANKLGLFSRGFGSGILGELGTTKILSIQNRIVPYGFAKRKSQAKKGV